MTRAGRLFLLAALALGWCAPALAAFFVTGEGVLEVLAPELEYRDARSGEFANEVLGLADWNRQGAVPFKPRAGRVDLWVRAALPAGLAGKTIYIGTGPWEHADYFFFADGRLIHQELSGQRVPWEERRTRVRMTPLVIYGGLVTLQVPHNAKVTMLVRLASEQRIHAIERLAFSVRDQTQSLEGERRDLIAMGLFLGVMLALVLYNFGLYVAVREVSYLYYVGIEIGTALIWCIYFGLAVIHLWPRHPEWDMYALWICGLFSGTAFAQFVRSFLDMKSAFPRLDAFWKWQVWIGLALLPAIFLLPSPIGSVFAVLTLAMPLGGLMIVVSVAYAAWKKHPLAPNLLLAVSAIALGSLTLTANNFGWVPRSDIAAHGMQIGTAVMGIILSIGLGYRLKRLNAALADRQLAEARLASDHEREKRELIEAQSRVLEIKVEERTAELASERERAEQLLGNILPRAIIEELKTKGTSEPRRHDEATILFTDFAGFTETAGTMPPARLVRELDEIFRGFDAVIAENGLEKIKTIGDAYMAAAGLPLPAPDHAVRCARAALALAAFIEARNRESAVKWRLRIGVHSGAVIAGIVGKDKYVYDVWGDTVNIASRLESAGEAGRVNVSAYTCELVREAFEVEYRGKIAAKGKGEMDMYFVKGPRANIN